MKKVQFVLVLLSLLAMLTSIAAAPLAASAIALLEVRNDPGGNVIFVFSVNGQFSKSQLKGFVQVQGNDANYPMGCNQVDENTVQCTTSKKTGGQNVVVTFGGATFWAHVPEAALQYCYNVWDWPLSFGFAVSELQFFPYEIQTVHCQDTPANYGDVVSIYNPVWEEYYDYEFLPGCLGMDDSAYWYECIVAN